MAPKKKEMQGEPVAPTPEVRPSTWADPGTWTGSYKFLPAYVAFGAVAIALVYANFFHEASFDISSYKDCIATFDHGFRVNAVLSQAHEHSKHSWEIGYAHEATQQIFNPERSVFGSDPFPDGKVPKLGLRLDEASVYAESKIKLQEKSLFDEENGAVSDPASLGVAALMFAQRGWLGKQYLKATARQKDLLLEGAPRYSNGAISHRHERPELWSDAIAMFPPFLAYYGVADNDTQLIKVAYEQITKYKDILQIRSGPKKGLWKHIVSPSTSNDEGAWSTGNAWAAYGMARVRATISAWPRSNDTMQPEIQQLDIFIQDIIDGAIATDTDASGLLRNYLGEDQSFGETSGTSLLAATAYRMALLRSEIFGHERYLTWAHRKRQAVFEKISEDGIVRQAAQSLDHKANEPGDISPEGESFALLMAAAWRDCVCNGLCLSQYEAEVGEVPQSTAFTLESLLGFSVGGIWQRISKYFAAP
ncbi:hypothetical protein HII31_09451 [Pseudocercospora fuligena]|uniref:Glycoside hydrolase family 88 protein n=1 Tax=Pseudocercospora fuligena TaxID=685502 RepID=A0A8H6VEE8_9PEZI|nr:hypothetical protein HII31_09451 [Pseudocercospora fuligena]